MESLTKTKSRVFTTTVNSKIKSKPFLGDVAIFSDPDGSIALHSNPNTELLVVFADSALEFHSSIKILMNFESLIEQLKVVMKNASKESIQIERKVHIENVPYKSFQRFLNFYDYIYKYGKESEIAAHLIEWERRWYGQRSELEKSWNAIHDDLIYASELKAMDLVYYYSGMIRTISKPFTKCPLFQYSQI